MFLFPIHSGEREMGRYLSAEEKEKIWSYVRNSELLSPRLIAKVVGHHHESTIQNVLHEHGFFPGKGSRPMRKPTITIPKDVGKIGYIAGLFDGEGHLSLRKQKQSFHGLTFNVTIYNSEKKIMDWLLANIGGKSYVRDRRGTSAPFGPRMKKSYSWFLTRTLDVILLLEAVRPYLVIKKEKADEILHHCKDYVATTYGKAALPFLLKS